MVDQRTGKRYKRKVRGSLNHHVAADLCLLEGAILPEPRTSLEWQYLSTHPSFTNFLLGINNRERPDTWVFNSDREKTVSEQQIHWGENTLDNNKNCAVMRDDMDTLSANREDKLVYPITCDGTNMVQGKQSVCEKNEGILS